MILIHTTFVSPFLCFTYFFTFQKHSGLAYESFHEIYYTKNKTAPRITKYETSFLIGKRATQLEAGASPNIKTNIGQSVISIAEEELRQRKIPLIIKRPLGNNFEYWKPADMEINMD